MYVEAIVRRVHRHIGSLHGVVVDRVGILGDSAAIFVSLLASAPPTATKSL